jgi:electron transport complex protein RnfC
MKRLHRFHGGIHPPENKRQSLRQPLRSAGIPAELVLPLNQHIGAPAEPCVAVGQRVAKGERIATARGAVSAAVHAPTSGTITAIESRPIAHPSGLTAPCLVLACDGEDRWGERQPLPDYATLPREDVLAYLRDSGIAGMGGAGFPTANKLATSAQIETLLINAAECEPYITADDCLLQTRPAEVLDGAAIIARLCRAQQILIGIEDNKPQAIAALREALTQRSDAEHFELAVIPTLYPSGGERQLIEILTGKQVPSGGLPADLGIICQNVATAAAVYRALEHGEPLLARITTVTGEAVRDPGNFEVLLGTPVRHVLAQAGFASELTERLIMGGPMMGFTLPSLDVPVGKTTNCLLAPTPAELPLPPAAQPCIRCGLCAQVCPATLLPQQLFWFAQARDYDQLKAHQLADCIECGACSWVCPSHIPLVQYYRASKAEIRKLDAEHRKAEQARLRFEAREQRLARETAEREVKRAARRQAATARAEDGEDRVAQLLAAAQAKKEAAAGAPPADPDANPRSKLERDQALLRNKLASARDKLAALDPGAEVARSALERSVEKLEGKLAEVHRELEHLTESNPA